MVKKKILNIWKYDLRSNIPKKNFFQFNIEKIKKLTKNEFISLIDYKNNDHNQIINKLLNLKKFPLILNYKPSENKKKYILPDDMYKLKSDYINGFIKKLNVYDNIFKKMNTLPNIVLYRGLKVPNKDKKTKKSDISKSKSNIKSKIKTNIKSNINKYHELDGLKYENKYDYKIGEIINNNGLLSTSLSLNVAYDFTGFQKNKRIIVKINIHKKDKIPFIFLSNTLFDYGKKKNKKILDEWNKSIYDEFEILLPRNIQYKVIKKSLVRIPRKTYGFKNIYNKKYEELTLYEVETLPYVFPKIIDRNYFTKMPSFISF